MKLDAKNFSDDYIYLADIALRNSDVDKAKEHIKKAAPSENKNRLKSIIKNLEYISYSEL